MNKLVLEIAKKIKNEGGRVLIVGGFVRDKLLGQESKDIDLEVYGVEFEKLREILESLGKVGVIGESFAVFQINGIDVSIPRKDNKIGKGHKGFEIEADPEMSFKEASSRRDFTINALALDPLTEEILDEHGGRADLENKVLRAVDHKTFGDDPLRALRAMQLAARFGFVIEDETKKLCQEFDLTELSSERIGEEWKKLLLKAGKPSIGLELARELKIIEKLHPELGALINTPQEPQWHPEGDVWEHTKLSVDEVAKIIRRENLGEEDSLVIMLAGLTHDLGKPATTKKEDGRIRSHGHAKAGEKLTRHFLKSLSVSRKIVSQVIPLVLEHQFFRLPEFTDKAVRRLSVRVEPATIKDLVWVMEADLAARADASREFHGGKEIIEKAEKLDVVESPPAPLVSGDDLKKIGFEQGPDLGEALDKLYQAQLDGKINSKEEGLEYIKQEKLI